MYLLDTHALLWAVNEPDLLSGEAAHVVESGEVAVSAASLWELLVKKGKPNAPLTNPVHWWQRHVTQAGVQVLPIQAYHIRLLETLPPLHKDPFDRILICQAIHEEMQLVTNDREIRRYEAALQIVW